jgi:hypothetical protein
LQQAYLELGRIPGLEFNALECQNKVVFAQERPNFASATGDGKSLPLLQLRRGHPGYSRAKSLEDQVAG